MKKILATFLILTIAAIARGEEIVVEGGAVQSQEAAQPTSTATIIDTSGAMNRVRDVGDAVQESAGVTVRRYGGLGDYSVIMVRGTSPNQMGIYLQKKYRSGKR